MQTSDELFLLIKSLSPSEKRHFKVFASKHVIGGDKNNYVKLFDAINKQNDYSEIEIKGEFSKHSFIKRLPSEKNYLYKLILKSLGSYYHDGTVDLFLKERLKQIQILYAKALYKQSQKILTRVKKIAYKHEKYLQVLEILHWEHLIIRSELNFEESGKIIKQIFREMKQVLEIIKNLNEYKELSSEIFIEYRKTGVVRSKNDADRFEKIITAEILQDENKAISYEAKYYFYGIFTNYYFAKNDILNGYEICKKHLKLIESGIEDHKENLHQYVIVFMGLLSSCLHLRKFDEFKTNLIKFREIPDRFHEKSERIHERIFTSGYLHESEMYIKQGSFDKGVEIIPQMTTGLEKYADKINSDSRMAMYYNIAYLYFGTDAYTKTSAFLNHIINDTDIEFRRDIYCFARILNLVLHYELGNDDLLEYIVKSTYRFLYKRKRLYKFETSFLDFIRQKLPKVKSNKELVGAFKELKIELEAIAKDPFEKKALEYFDFISWLESKIGNRPFAEIVKEKMSR